MEIRDSHFSRGNPAFGKNWSYPSWSAKGGDRWHYDFAIAWFEVTYVENFNTKQCVVVFEYLKTSRHNCVFTALSFDASFWTSRKTQSVHSVLSDCWGWCSSDTHSTHARFSY